MADTTLLTSLVEHTEESERGFTVTRFSVGGEPQAAAIVNAVAANWHRVLGSEPVTQDELTQRIGEKVTLVLTGDNVLGAGMLVAREGTLFAGSRTPVAILPKGKRKNGFGVDPSRVLAVLPGYNAAAAKRLADEVRSHYPLLERLTKERLEQLPRSSDTCTLAVFGTYRLPDCVASDALWLIGEYWPDDDIVETCVLLLREEHGVSEHGSVYGEQLLRSQVGVVVGFQPVSFGEAIKLTGLGYEEAVAKALGGAAAAAA